MSSLVVLYLYRIFVFGIILLIAISVPVAFFNSSIWCPVFCSIQNVNYRVLPSPLFVFLNADLRFWELHKFPKTLEISFFFRYHSHVCLPSLPLKSEHLHGLQLMANIRTMYSHNRNFSNFLEYFGQ